jgi:hypothetical protein
MVFEPILSIKGKVKQASLISDRDYRQEIGFEVITNNFPLINIYNNLHVTILQNSRWDNALQNIQPKMMVGEKLDYHFDNVIVFNGGNEFRAFDTKSLTYNTEYVSKIDYTYEGYQVFLKPGEKRTFMIYKTEEDINGRMKIKTEDKDQTETQAEYVQVYFFLNHNVPMIDADFYILGQLTDWQFSEMNRMVYNFQKKGYEKTMLLKQGYYNYQYVLKYHGQTSGDETFVEGNHRETENDYTVLIYYREPGKYYDRLIGVEHLNSLTEQK